MLDAIRAARLDTLFGDTRLLHRAIIEAQLIVPLHEAPINSPQGTRLRFITVEDDSVLCVFTGEEYLRDFFQDTEKHITQHLMSGGEICRLAAGSDLRKIIINPNAEILYAMHPPVFRTLAEGYVPASLTQLFPGYPGGPMSAAFVACPGGLPSSEALAALTLCMTQNYLQNANPSEAIWFGALTPEGEIFFGLAIESAPEWYESLKQELFEIWVKHWPIKTPLWILPLGENPFSQQIREYGEAIFRSE